MEGKRRIFCFGAEQYGGGVEVGGQENVPLQGRTLFLVEEVGGGLHDGRNEAALRRGLFHLPFEGAQRCCLAAFEAGEG